MVKKWICKNKRKTNVKRSFPYFIFNILIISDMVKYLIEKDLGKSTPKTNEQANNEKSILISCL